MNGPQASGASPVLPRFGEIAADAMRYWEPRRVLYNLVLTGVVLAHFITAWPGSRVLLAWNTLFELIFLGVLANVCYCAAYAVDLFAQYSALRAVWVRRRWVLLAVGITFAAVIAHFFSLNLFSGPGAE